MSRLPAWKPPKSEAESDRRIRILTRRTLADTYLLGRELIWRKEALGYGSWLQWVEMHLDCSVDTTERLRNYAVRCVEAKRLVPFKEIPILDGEEQREIPNGCGIPKLPVDLLERWNRIVPRVQKLVAMAMKSAQRDVVVADLKRLIGQLEAEVPSNVIALDAARGGSK